MPSTKRMLPILSVMLVASFSAAQVQGWGGQPEEEQARRGKPHPSLLSRRNLSDPKEAEAARRRCIGRDLLVRDLWTGEGRVLGPAEGHDVIPIPSDDTERWGLECVDGYLLELDSPPLALRNVRAPRARKLALHRINVEQSSAIDQIRRLVPEVEVVSRSSIVFNGIHIRVGPKEAARLREAGFRLWENAEVRAELMDSIPLIRADQAWTRTDTLGLSVTGQGMRIAIIDTGVDYTHPDLGAGCSGFPYTPLCKVAGGYDVVNDDSDPMDDQGHGTHVAAIAAGNGALKGVAPDASIWAYKVLRSDGSGTWDDIREGIERAIDPNGDGNFIDGAHVLNLSLGGYGTPDSPISTAVDAASATGAVVVVAAGNESWGSTKPDNERNTMIPGAARSALTVGATWKQDWMAWFSSRGPVVWNDQAIMKPDLVAPGVEICAARWGGWFQTSSCGGDGQHVALSGTSMATPHVAGVAALVRQKHPSLAPDQVKAVIKGSANALSSDQSAVSRGTGRVDALAAVDDGQDHPTAVLKPISMVGDTRMISGQVTGLGTGGWWRLEYARYAGHNFPEGQHNRPWVLLAESDTAPPTEDLLELDTNVIPDGEYIIRLTVASEDGRTAVDHGYTLIDKLRFTSPLDGDVHRRGATLSVALDVDPSVEGDLYTLEYAVGANPGTWVEVAESHVPSFEWNTGGLSDRYISLRVRAEHDGITESTKIIIRLDPRLREGWPVRIPTPTEIPCRGFGPCSTERGWLEPVIEDVDGDGTPEIIFLRFDLTPEVWALDEEGSQVWRTPLGSAAAGPWDHLGLYVLHPPVIGDADGDGDKEIYAFNAVDSTLYVLDGSGELLHAWSVNTSIGSGNCTESWDGWPPMCLPRLILADVDHDGRDDIVLSTFLDAKISVLSTVDGSEKARWSPPSAPSGTIMLSPYLATQAPAVGDITSDGQLEVVLSRGNPGKVSVVTWDGREVWSEQAPTGGAYLAPVVGDLSGDQRPEVIAAFGYMGDGHIFAIEGTGETLPGWPVRISDRYPQGGTSLADLNGDGSLELIFPTSFSQVRALDHEGRDLDGWPASIGRQAYHPAAVGDLDGNGQLDLAGHGAGGSDGYIKGLSGTGTPLSGFDLPLERFGRGSVALARLGSGSVGMIATSDDDFHLEELTQTHVKKDRYSIHLWDLQSSFDPDLMPWPMFQHDLQRSGNFEGPNAHGTLGPPPPGPIITTSISIPPPDCCSPMGAAVTDGDPVTWEITLEREDPGLGPTSCTDCYVETTRIRQFSASSCATPLDIADLQVADDHYSGGYDPETGGFRLVVVGRTPEGGRTQALSNCIVVDNQVPYIAGVTIEENPPLESGRVSRINVWPSEMVRLPLVMNADFEVRDELGPIPILQVTRYCWTGDQDCFGIQLSLGRRLTGPDWGTVTYKPAPTSPRGFDRVGLLMADQDVAIECAGSPEYC